MVNKLSVRRPGWPRADEVTDTGLAEAREATRLVILIHGFNVSEQNARWAFMDMRAGLRAAIPGGLGKLGAIWEYHWPGDHPSGGAWSAGTYAVRVPIAAECGRLLVDDWLVKRTKSETMILIAHSLGCRVALEAVKRIGEMRARYTGPAVEAVFLLAAAVPVDFCTPGHRHVRFGKALAMGEEHVFHSRRDRALGRVFDTGQALIPEPGNAVGRLGLPDDRWSGGMRMRLKHGDYWASRKIAHEIAEQLHLSRERSMAEDPLPEQHPEDDAQPLREQRPGMRRLRARPV